MKKIYQVAAAGLLLLAAAAPPASAKLLLTENFDYPAGNLLGNGGWIQYGNKTNDPITLSASQLSYAGYQEATGMAAKLTSTSTSQNAYKTWGTYDNDRINSGTIYASVLLNVNTPGDDTYSFNLVGMSVKNAGIAAKTGDEMARIYTQAVDESHYKVGTAKNASKGVYADAVLETGKTYLIVIKYEFVDGTKNDIASIWINPDMKAEPSVADAQETNSADVSATNGFIGIEIHHGGNGGRSGGVMQYDAIRVATTWAELFGDQDEPVNPDPQPTDAAITTDKTELAFDPTYQFLPAELIVTVKGEKLTGAVSASVNSTDFTVTPSTISADEAMSEDGAIVTVKLTAKTAGEKAATLTLKADGAADVTIPLSGTVVAVKTLQNSLAVQNQAGDGAEAFYYDGIGATVTHIDASTNRVYAQDMSGGICFDFGLFETPYDLKLNDKVKGLHGLVIQDETTSANVFVPMFSSMTVTEGTAKEPLEISAAELARDPETYIFRLVKLDSEVEFANVADGQTFAAKTVQGKSGETTVNVMPFPGSDLIGMTVPQKASSVAGISFSPKAVTLRPRSASDVEMPNPAAPALDITVEKLYSEAYAEIGTTYPFARLTVDASNLERAAQIYLSGTNRAMFAIDTEEIPAGTATYTVNVIYTPTAVGKHTANLLFDATPTELSQSFALSAVAIDPANPPLVSADASTITEFTAEVGKPVSQTLAVTTANMADYGNARLTKGSGAFLLNSTSLLKNASTNLTITFSPKAAGTFTDELELSAPGGNTVVIPLKGVATGQGTQPTDPEGDSLDDLSDLNPVTYFVEDMETAVPNKPFQAEGWLNVANEGTRAWWGMAFKADGSTATDGVDAVNRAAKVTAYDFFATDDTPAMMTLISPAVDYKNTTAKFLTFRAMGQNLSDETPIDPLNVWYLERDGQEVLAGSFGIEIPTGSDADRTWNEYIVDLDGLDLPDVMWFAFNFQSLRGKNSSVIWYVDDVTWGRQDIPFIRPVEKLHEFAVAPGATYAREFEVTGLNLTGPIGLKMVGSHASAYTLSETELPKEGGKFTVTFASAVEEMHTGFVELSSEGAPKSYIELHGTPDKSLGVGAISLDGNGAVRFIVVDGTLSTTCASTVAIALHSANGALCGSVEGNAMGIAHLAPGIYIATATLADGTTVDSKIVLK